MAGSFATIVAMTLLLPFLPLYVQELGVRDHAAIVQWSGIAYGMTFLGVALCAPLWGHLADRHGRKPILISVSLGMAVAVSLIGMANNVGQLIGLRLLVGLLGGYTSVSMALVATQAPKERLGWALGMLSSAILVGSLTGPLIGGGLSLRVGIRLTFLCVGAALFLAFIATALGLREARNPPRSSAADAQQIEADTQLGWVTVINWRPVFVMLATSTLLMLATMLAAPIITVYVSRLVTDSARITQMAGLSMSAAMLGSVLSAARWGRLADRIGPWPVVTLCLSISAVLLVPQAFVTAPWPLVLLRFLMGLALGGLAPCIAAVICHHVPTRSIGALLGYCVSAQYVGQLLGPLLGGFIGWNFGMRAVFLSSCALLAAVALWNMRERRSRPA